MGEHALAGLALSCFAQSRCGIDFEKLSSKAQLKTRLRRHLLGDRIAEATDFDARQLAYLTLRKCPRYGSGTSSLRLGALVARG